MGIHHIGLWILHTSNHANLSNRLLLPVPLFERTLDIDSVAYLHRVHMAAHNALRIVLDDKVNIALEGFYRGRSVRANDFFSLAILCNLGAEDDARSNRQACDICLVGKLETEETDIVVDAFDFFELINVQMLAYD